MFPAGGVVEIPAGALLIWSLLTLLVWGKVSFGPLGSSEVPLVTRYLVGLLGVHLRHPSARILVCM